jgi:hypothetical protein
VTSRSMNTSGTLGTPLGYCETLTLTNLGKGRAVKCIRSRRTASTPRAPPRAGLTTPLS